MPAKQAFKFTMATKTNIIMNNDRRAHREGKAGW